MPEMETDPTQVLKIDVEAVSTADIAIALEGSPIVQDKGKDKKGKPAKPGIIHEPATPDDRSIDPEDTGSLCAGSRVEVRDEDNPALWHAACVQAINGQWVTGKDRGPTYDVQFDQKGKKQEREISAIRIRRLHSCFMHADLTVTDSLTGSHAD
jgi:hypothetical protein